MKIAAVALFCIILTVIAWPETVTVNAGLPQPPELSSSHVRIAVMLDGKPLSVLDCSGAVLPGAKIRILKNGPEGRAFVLGLSADAAGHFSAQLSPGPCLGIFDSEGFCVEAVSFGVTKEGSGDVRVGPQVGPMALPIWVATPFRYSSN